MPGALAQKVGGYILEMKLFSKDFTMHVKTIPPGYTCLTGKLLYFQLFILSGKNLNFSESLLYLPRIACRFSAKSASFFVTVSAS
ncbi:hypothetical protein DC498_18280 [Terrimonas sp.]|nr:hypothetical protein DC498_18280 [Terrimonas sp.]